MVGLIAAALAIGGGTGHASSAESPRITDVRVCSYTHFSLDQSRCVTDDRGSTVVSSRFVCSFTVESNTSGIVSLGWLYDGVPFSPAQLRFGIGSARDYVKVDTGGGLPEPGGVLECLVSAGTARATATLQSAGPTGAIVDAAVCLGAHARRVGSQRNFPVCQQDESAQPVLAAVKDATVVCNAIYPNQIGRDATIELLHDGSVLGLTKFRINYPLTQAYIERPSPPGLYVFPPGNYTCRFTIGGGQAVESSFSIVAP
jgi:hypothetical protein